MTQLQDADWSLIPEHLRDGLRRYIEQGVMPGGFLTAVLSNDLVESVGRADAESLPRLRDIIQFIYWHAPSRCWGSPEVIDEWSGQGGLNGRAAA